MKAAPVWICCQLGAREHYAAPRALHRAGRLARLVTDAWSPAPLRGIGRLGQRYDPDLATADVTSFTPSLLGSEVLWRISGYRGWDHFIARNRWFQSRAASSLRRMREQRPALVFAHSYAARDIFTAAKRRGWTTVLGQIDPGPEHYAIQERINGLRSEYKPFADSPPAQYFESWRDECALADHIVVNSRWSEELVGRAGVPQSKMRVISLPYEASGTATSFQREHVLAYSATRPLRALFVGTASVTKGVPEILEAVERLADAPIEVHFVGHLAIEIPRRFRAHPKVRWVGPVDRDAVMNFYRTSDVLLFPSHSDGFGMAQVEATAWSLPIVASRHCGEVVRDGETGIVLDHVSSDTLAAALRRLIAEPGRLAAFTTRARHGVSATLASFGEGLLALERT